MAASTETATTDAVAPSRATGRASSQEGGAASAALLSQIRDLGRTLDDIERARIQVGNRIAAIGRGEEVVYDGQVPPAVLASFELLQRAEAEIVGELERTWKRHALYHWSRHVPGVGEKLIARLLAEIGDPTLRPIGHFENENDVKRQFVIDGYEPRSLAQLCAYTGHGDPNRRKRASRNGSGMTQTEALRLGNPVAKKRVWLIATAGIKARCPACREAAKEREDASYLAPPEGCTCKATHPLRFAYDHRRRVNATKIHDEGVRVGEPWTAGHQHADALRYTGKKFLKLLYAAALDPEGAAKATKERRAATAAREPSLGTIVTAPSRNGQGASS